ncbi:hypothetical protein CR203_16855 [Salipaludibacillus neizhouensis]|uniref:HPr family phosphocarrier protein n=1 Tax=Salipaludibacillus neizhouensis TaxID=885475 RepID=A0A3A9K6U0_9BACI|nr:hypothetical protein [Salipaludibacillus neizhouensis]RKL66222.1 hypothetical protein CR203_16855 [Salipaludibacillus neizhouensis]
MIIQFQIKNNDEVIKLNKIATQYTYDIWVHSDNQMFDAKTLLALYTLPFKTDLKMVIEDDVNSKALLKDMEYFQK